QRLVYRNRPTMSPACRGDIEAEITPVATCNGLLRRRAKNELKMDAYAGSRVDGRTIPRDTRSVDGTDHIDVELDTPDWADPLHHMASSCAVGAESSVRRHARARLANAPGQDWFAPRFAESGDG